MPGGAPEGNQNAVKGKRWTQAIDRCLESWPEPPSDDGCAALIIGLNKAAFEFLKTLHTTKDLGFFKELGDRQEGKPNQSLSGPDGGPLQIEAIQRNIVDPQEPAK